MDKFESLEAALNGHFDSPFAKLPKALRERVERSFPGFSDPNPKSKRSDTFPPWDVLAREQRREFARQWDLNNDPALEQEREDVWDSTVKCNDLEREIAGWHIMGAHTPTERLAKEHRIVELQRELADAIRKRDQTTGAFDKTRAVGRPTSKTLIAAELERRISRGELETGVAAQARALELWLSVHHKKEPQATADTIEINIRDRFREAGNASQK